MDAEVETVDEEEQVLPAELADMKYWNSTEAIKLFGVEKESDKYENKEFIENK